MYITIMLLLILVERSLKRSDVNMIITSFGSSSHKLLIIFFIFKTILQTRITKTTLIINLLIDILTIYFFVLLNHIIAK